VVQWQRYRYPYVYSNKRGYPHKYTPDMAAGLIQNAFRKHVFRRIQRGELPPYGFAKRPQHDPRLPPGVYEYGGRNYAQTLGMPYDAQMAYGPNYDQYQPPPYQPPSYLDRERQQFAYTQQFPYAYPDPRQPYYGYGSHPAMAYGGRFPAPNQPGPYDPSAVPAPGARRDARYGMNLCV